MFDMDSPEAQALIADNSDFMTLVFDSMTEATKGREDAETGEIVEVIVKATKPEDVARFYKVSLVYAVAAIHREAVRQATAQANPLKAMFDAAGLGDLFDSLDG